MPEILLIAVSVAMTPLVAYLGFKLGCQAPGHRDDLRSGPVSRSHQKRRRADLVAQGAAAPRVVPDGMVEVRAIAKQAEGALQQGRRTGDR